MSWAFNLTAPGVVRRVEGDYGLAPLKDGQVRLRFVAGGLCGSDMPLFLGVGVDFHRVRDCRAPMHELVADVVESRSSTLLVGQRVVGTSPASVGLCELSVQSDQTFVTIPSGMAPAAAVAIQSIGTVLRAVERIPNVAGSRAAVIGTGPIGLVFIHALRARGARHVTAVDPVPHQRAARNYGADEYVQAHSSQWVLDFRENDRPRPTLVIEAAGHQHVSIRDAIFAVADNGFVFGFGRPGDNEYALPYREIYQRNLTLTSGRTRSGWRKVLEMGREYLINYEKDFGDYVTHVIDLSDAQVAYSLYAHPQRDRRKVVLIDASE